MPDSPLRPGLILTGPLFNEPMRVETIRPGGPESWVAGLVGLQSERFRSVTLTDQDLARLHVQDPLCSFDGNGKLLRLGIQAYSLGIAYEFDPYFGLSISRVDPLPHQLEAVYDYLLKLARVRFLLADDAGAGKTIMAGLLIRELKLRGLAERVLIVCPANLAFQWQRELKEKFDEKFVVMRGNDLREQFGVNQWLEQGRIITSLDLAKRDEILPGLRQVRWDLVIVDEAHRLSWTPPARKTARYALGELLRDTSDHILLLTATPHKGDPANFSLFLQLLDADAYADIKSIREAMDRRRAPFYLRRTKEAMVYFPERQPDGSWVARKIFTKRIPHTAGFDIDGAEFQLYRDVTRFVKVHSGKAASQGDDPRARAVGFLMSLYQRRLASSTYALRHSLENRARRLGEALKRAQQVVQYSPPDLPDPEELEEMEEDERERIEELLAAATLARNAGQVREEIADLQALAAQAQTVEDAGAEAKLAQLRVVLQEEGFFDDPQKRLLLFTEFKDTLDYLVQKLTDWGFKVGFIHGGMAPGSRDDPDTRLYAEQQFRDGEIQVLMATEAAGEGINLQVCHILFNYDIPWNPNRLEQRMGRIHRYGQTRDCLIFNFVATNTIEGRVLQRLLEKLQEIRNALDDDAVFNVVGEVLPAAQIERILRDYYAGRMGDADLEDRLLKDVDEGRFRAICQNALEGLATKKLNLEMLIERRARAQERRVVPETIARFLADAAEFVPMTLRPVPKLLHAFDPPRTPTVLRRHEGDPDWRLPRLVDKYPRCSTDRDTADHNHLEWVTPGHPLFEAVRRHTLAQARPELARGACYYSLRHERPARLDLYRARVVDGLGQVVHERAFAVEIGEDGSSLLQDTSVLGNLTPAPLPASLPAFALQPEPTGWLHEHALSPFLQEVGSEMADVRGTLSTAEEDARDEVWAAYRYVVIASGRPGGEDQEDADGLKVIDLGAGHASTGETLCGRVVAALKAEGLLNESVGAGYIERNWPTALKASGAWPLTSLRQAFLNGALTRLLDADTTLRKKLVEFVEKGDFGLASGQNPEGTYQRLWLGEPVNPGEVTFDAGVFLLTKAKAQALKAKPVQEKTGVEQKTKTDTDKGEKVGPGGGTDGAVDQDERPVVTPQTTRLVLEGEVPAEVWNRIGMRLLTKLRSGEDVKIEVRFGVTVKAEAVAGMEADLKQALQDLGLEERVKIRRA